MGSFIGHVVPGTFFALFGVWFTFRVFQRYFTCQRAAATLGEEGHSRYRNTSSFSCPCSPGLPLEGCFKIIAAVVGMTGEFITAFEDGKFSYVGNAQHMTMFFFFGLNGAVDVLTHYRLLLLLPDLDFVSAILAFTMEALLFFYHLHGRSHMDIQVHMLLFYVVVACAVSTTLEMCYKTNVLPAVCRAYFTLLQGTWFYQIGFILYPPSGEAWDQHSHTQMMIVTLLFTWHNATIFVVMAMVGSLIYLRVKMLPPSALYHSLHRHAPLQTLKGPDADHTKNILQDSDDEGV